MDVLQRIEVDLGDTRRELRGLLDKEERSDTEAQRVDALTEKLQRLDRDRTAALLCQEPAKPDILEQRDAQGAEARDLVAEANLGKFFAAASTGRDVDGVELECRAALLGDNADTNSFPIDLIVPKGVETEQRADTVTTLASDARTQTNQATMARVFAGTAAARLRVAMPVVSGTHVVPYISAGGTPEMKARGAAVDSAALTWTAESLAPVRLTARASYSIEDSSLLPEMDSVIRNDLFASMTDQHDEQILAGSGTAPNLTGFFNVSGLQPTAETTKDTNQSIVKKFLDQVDGTTATTSSDIHACMGSTVYSYIGTLFEAANRRGTTWDYLQDRLGSIFVSSRVPDASSGVQNVLCANTAYPGMSNAIAPYWRQVFLVDDRVTGAASGVINLTVAALIAFQVIREDAYTILSIKTTS